MDKYFGAKVLAVVFAPLVAIVLCWLWGVGFFTCC